MPVKATIVLRDAIFARRPSELWRAALGIDTLGISPAKIDLAAERPALWRTAKAASYRHRSKGSRQAMARLLFLLLLTAAQGKRKGVNVKKKEKVELDDARLPPLHEVLAELDLDVDELLARGVETTRQLCAWGRSDISIHGNDLGWDRDKQKVINEKINAIRADAAVQKTTETVDPLKAARDERNALTYGRVVADRATASFEFKKAWFGADFPENLRYASGTSFTLDSLF